jgi:hypothetical protein
LYKFPPQDGGAQTKIEVQFIATLRLFHVQMLKRKRKLLMTRLKHHKEHRERKQKISLCSCTAYLASWNGMGSIRLLPGNLMGVRSLSNNEKNLFLAFFQSKWNRAAKLLSIGRKKRPYSMQMFIHLLGFHFLEDVLTKTASTHSVVNCNTTALNAFP